MRLIGLVVVLTLSLMMVLTTEAQQAGKVHRVGIVSIGSAPKHQPTWQPFLDGMRELGYIEGRNLVVERAFAGGRAEDLPGLIKELGRAGVEVVVTTVKRALSTTPLVMLVVPDPVGQGFVKTLARPSGTVTGMTNLVPSLLQKYVELLREAVPAASRFAVIAGPPNPAPENPQGTRSRGQGLQDRSLDHPREYVEEGD